MSEQDSSKREKEIISIPRNKVGPVIGRRGAGIQNITSTSGAKVWIEDNQVVITGSLAQVTSAKALINKIIGSETPQVGPSVGFVLLEIGDEQTKDGTLKFSPFQSEDVNAHSRRRQSYYVRFTPKKEEEAKDDDSGELVAAALSQLSTASPDTKTCSFNTTEKLPYCLGEINSILGEVDPSTTETKEIRVNLFFGRQLFSNVHNLNNYAMDLRDWCKIDREGSNISTSFQHHIPQILDKIETIKEKYGFEEERDNKERLSILIDHLVDNDRRKVKLHWDPEEEKWKITKVTKVLRRVAILDIISGSGKPDFRLLLKNHRRDSIDDKLSEFIAKLQSDGLTCRDQMWFRRSDFLRVIDVECVRQKIRKKCYRNDKYQITFESILRDDEEHLTESSTIDLKHLSWRKFHEKDHLNDPFNKDDLQESILETVHFARELVKQIK